MLPAFASQAAAHQFKALSATQSASQTAISPFGGALSGSSSVGDAADFADALSSAASISSAGGISGAGGMNPAAAGAVSASAPFSDLLVQSVRQVDQLEQTARSSIEGLISGKGVDVHEAMVATEKAEMGFDMAVAVRDKALAAYQQVMSMQF